MARPKKGAISKDQAIAALWENGVLRWKLREPQIAMYDAFLQSQKRKFVINSSRRVGKCLVQGTLVDTPNGPVKIEELKRGDTLYGVNQDGSLSPCKVLAVQLQGKRAVYDIKTIRGEVIARCSADHRFQAQIGRAKKVLSARYIPPGGKIIRKSTDPKVSLFPYVVYSVALVGTDTCWDIEIDNETKLFLLANGAVSHNSHLLCTIAIEHALKYPYQQIKYAAPTKTMVREIIQPNIRKILADCPQHLRPTWHSQTNRFIFPNGSQIDIAGAEAGNADSLRGTDAHLGIVDEAAFISDLDYLVKDVLLPMCLTTNGRVIIASTPPKTPRHPFELYTIEAQRNESYIHKTIHDSVYPPETIKEFMQESGGEESTTWKREYLAQFIIDSELVVVPEFTRDLAAYIVTEVERPSHFDAYVAMDIGFNDFTAVLFGYWDFLKARLVIEDELVLNQIRTDTLAAQIKLKEEALWGVQKPYFRVSDTDLILLNDLSQLHGLNFVTADKDQKEAAINEVRVMLQNKQIFIHPRCRELALHLQNAVWSKNREKFARIEGFGHFDCLDALIYMVRNIRKQRNPYPAQIKNNSRYFYVDPYQEKAGNARVLERLFFKKR